MKALVVYESMFGNTEQIARRNSGGTCRIEAVARICGMRWERSALWVE
jgi:menaquinone-dependent protoporphyrinogen IX oxidase